jgi:hypothetical protein
MNMLIHDRFVHRAGHRNLKYYSFEMPSWWGGRLKALRRISRRDAADAAVVGLFFLAMSILVVMPIAANM